MTNRDNMLDLSEQADWLDMVERVARIKGPAENMVVREMKTGIVRVCTEGEQPKCISGAPGGAGAFDDLVACLRSAGFTVEVDNEVE